MLSGKLSLRFPPVFLTAMRSGRFGQTVLVAVAESDYEVIAPMNVTFNSSKVRKGGLVDFPAPVMSMDRWELP